VRGWLLRSAVVACGFVLSAGSAHASSFTIDDSFTDNHVTLTWSIAGLSGVALSANCTALGVGQASCLETGPIVFSGDVSGLTDTPFPVGSARVNIWDDVVGGTISDTFAADATLVNATTIHGVFTFRSGPGVTAFPIADANWLESQGVFRARTGDGANGRDTLDLTIITSAVPEPGSLLLLVSGLVVVAWRRRASA
jgi:hypothetical protein